MSKHTRSEWIWGGRICGLLRTARELASSKRLFFQRGFRLDAMKLSRICVKLCQLSWRATTGSKTSGNWDRNARAAGTAGGNSAQPSQSSRMGRFQPESRDHNNSWP